MAKISARKAGPRSTGSKSKASSANKKNDFWSQHSHLFKSAPKNFGIGQSLAAAGQDLTRFTKWPKYVRVQRQRAILKRRLKVPPAIAAFAKTIKKNEATTLFRLLSKYRPETKKEKKQRLYEAAKNQVSEADQKSGDKPKVLKFGLKHVTQLIEERKAKLVLIAHDVDPIELVVWLPALCRKMDIPFAIVKGKARLGALVHQKTVTALALTEVSKEHQAQLEQLTKSFRGQFNDNVNKKWGGGIMGAKTQARMDKEQRSLDKKAVSKA